MSRRKANLEHEYALERENNDLKQEITKLKKRLRELEKSAIVDEVAEKKPAKKLEKTCPHCGAAIKEFATPIGKLDLCAKACGWREMRKK